jgi:hypothetical protein
VDVPGWLACHRSHLHHYLLRRQERRPQLQLCLLRYCLAAILANFIAGSSKDLFGGYDTAFIVTGILAAIGAVSGHRLMKPPKHT